MQTPNLGFGPLPGGYNMPTQPGSPQRKKMAILFAVGVGFVALVVMFALLKGHKDPAKDDLVKLVTSQGESIRLGTSFAPKLQDSTVKEHNAEMLASLKSSNNQLMAELKRDYGIKSVAGAQKTATNVKTDQALNAAAGLDQLDREYASTMADQLDKELNTAVQAEGEVKNQQTKAVLSQVANYLSDLRKRFSDAATTLAGGSVSN